jgi:hypothetical protein
MSKTRKHALEPEPYEFGGPIGTLFLIFFLPGVAYGLYFWCSQAECGLWPPHLPAIPRPLFTWEAMFVVVGWMAFQALLYVNTPGRIKKGVPLEETGEPLNYKLNGFTALIVSTTVTVSATVLGLVRPTYAYDNFLPLLTATTIYSFIQSILLYIASTFDREHNLSPGGNTGNSIYDFFIGRQLNPRIGEFDLKFFCELRPGLTAWLIINLSCAMAQYEKQGSIDLSMWLVLIGQLIYIADATLNEEAILTTYDIVHDGFGFMLTFGDLAWVPFTFSTQARYLVDYPNKIDVFEFAVLILVAVFGFAVFRLSNLQKHIFRSNPSDSRVKHLQIMNTSRGSKLLISGWWGMARHINYLGDWLQSFAWCLACGFRHGIPYFYSVYFASLLIHRQIRDDKRCKEKYGSDWDKYCKLVPYRIIPYVY